MSQDVELFRQLQSSLQQLNDIKTSTIEDKIVNLYASGLDAAFISSGWGEHNKQIVNNYAKVNRYGTRFCMDNFVKTGYTFITRPALNLSPINCRTDRVMNLLNTPNPLDINFALRSYLDTKFTQVIDPESVQQCPFIDYRSPFMTILTNNLVEFSGSPSYQLETFTDEPGFYGESQSMAIGSDSYRKPFDLQLTFVDPIGGPIEAMFRFWTRYIELVTKGIMIMYPDQEAARILNYTVSIYRFLMDPSFRYIRKYFKYTGCFPINRQGASVADYNNKDMFVDGLRKFSIGFKCGSGVVDEDDPIVIKEFNDLVARYFPDVKALRPSWGGDQYIRSALVGADQIDSTLKSSGLIRNPLLPEFNYSGVPYILDTQYGLKIDMISKNMVGVSEGGGVDEGAVKSASSSSSDYECNTQKHISLGHDEFGSPMSVWPLMQKYGAEIAEQIKIVDDYTANSIASYHQSKTGMTQQQSLEQNVYGITYV